MPIDPQEVNTAAGAVINSARKLRSLSAGMIDKVAGDVDPHPDTIAALKAEAATVRTQWQLDRDALDVAMTP